MESMENSYPIENKEKLCPGCREALIEGRCQNIQCDFFGMEMTGAEERNKEEFTGGWKENPELPESEFGSYQNIEKGKKEKTPVVVETEQEKRIKKFVWDMLDKDVELKDQIVFSRGGKNEIVSNFFKRKIESKVNEAVKGGKLMPEDTYNHCQKIWDELERIGDDVFIQAKGKIFLKAKE